MLVNHLLKAKREYRNWEKKKRRFKTYLSTYQNELVKTCFQFDMTYEDFKDLIRKTV